MTYRFSPQSKDDMDAIEKYYINIGNTQTGDHILESILSCVETLCSHPHLGHPEPMLREFPQGFRTFVDVPNYKIVYWLEEDIVKVATIFDCRQRPEKMYEIISWNNTWLCEPQVDKQYKYK
ncbi:type II toxin-antitoxin system RelE/ParE family toxin [Bacteroides sp. 519]|uniref:type II toxin-antitoxin system RelE/ParE family toxin n=1 Tax=Bacteroides sp. 519 TaxID=2302937 RepID=UPI0013D45D21|nr:type II toxin-antitoxin system RelE/ParE family toxin [Bacteroides sp. 519]NDV58396.1 type II toxin-antitoxin system RelE/ParE family toxin [Bacteroides sp. 519]